MDTLPSSTQIRGDNERDERKKLLLSYLQKGAPLFGNRTSQAMHRDRKEDCEITYTNGDTYIHKFSTKKWRGYAEALGVN